MATKYLARTIIEGGRARYSKDERYQSHRDERAKARAFIAKASARPDGFDALSLELRDKVYKGFDDKLGPARRWLRAQIGRPWDKVRSEIFSRFDPRNLAGQHIIFDHLLMDVVVGPRIQRWRLHQLYVDAHGILRAPKPQKREPYAWRLAQISSADLAWLAGRRVIGEGTTWFWLVEHSACERCRVRRDGGCCCPTVDGSVRHGAHKHYRQAERFSDADLERWLAMHELARCKVSGPRE